MYCVVRYGLSLTFELVWYETTLVWDIINYDVIRDFHQKRGGVAFVRLGVKEINTNVHTTISTFFFNFYMHPPPPPPPPPTHTHTHTTQSNVNKMSLPNLVIVFSPTLQLSASILHALYNNAAEVLGTVELAK